MSTPLDKVFIPKTLRDGMNSIKEQIEKSTPQISIQEYIPKEGIGTPPHKIGPKDFPIRVIIEARLVDDHPVEDYSETKNLIQMLQGFDIPLKVTEITERYIFTSLTVEEIERIEQLLEIRDHELSGYLKRIWPDSEVKSMLDTSTKTVSADRAREEFFPNAGKDICWAVIDSGIDDKHPHFNNTNLCYKYKGGTTTLGQSESTVILRKSFLPGKKVGSLIHGTHVAAIIAGWCEDGTFFEYEEDEKRWMPGDQIGHLKQTSFKGIAPYAKLVDLVVLDSAPNVNENEDTGFSSRVIRAIHHIRKLNQQADEIIIHGANLSLGAQFKVDDFGCGHTPLCKEVDQLVESGVLVVVASGNEGFQRLRTKKENYTIDWQSHQDITISDPGNAELAITVGSTHRKRPLRYGVSFFSSRGPTADGRAKPEIIAPGEKILSANGGDHSKVKYIRKSGTSQATPHVSGALAFFLSKYPEYIGKPMLIKKFLLETCWDINRERYFQGHGVLDVYRLLEMPSP
jgi:hypothetical protein